MKYAITVWLGLALAFLLCLPYGVAEELDAAEVDTYPVLNRAGQDITIDAEFDEWRLADKVLVMGKDSWEPLGGTRKNDADISGEMRILWDTDNLYFAFQVTDDEYVAEGGNPWENDGCQMAIDATGGEIPPGLSPSTHLYNFSIKDGWLKENGEFQGDAEIEMMRDDGASQNVFEWRMPTEIFADKGTELVANMEIAFAIIANDSDEDAPGQTGWIGWGSHTIVFGKNPEEMQTLVLSSEALAVSAQGKLAATWGELKF